MLLEARLMINKKKIDPVKQSLFQDFKAFTRKLLGNCPVISLEELEEKIHRKFANTIAVNGYDKPLKSGRAEWANLLDWVKADLTQKGWISYFTMHEKTYIAFLVPCGYVKDIILVTRQEAFQLQDAIISVANSSDPSDAGRGCEPVRRVFATSARRATDERR